MAVRCCTDRHSCRVFVDTLASALHWYGTLLQERRPGYVELQASYCRNAGTQGTILGLQLTLMKAGGQRPPIPEKSVPQSGEGWYTASDPELKEDLPKRWVFLYRNPEPQKSCFLTKYPTAAENLLSHSTHLGINQSTQQPGTLVFLLPQAISEEMQSRRPPPLDSKQPWSFGHLQRGCVTLRWQK